MKRLNRAWLAAFAAGAMVLTVAPHSATAQAPSPVDAQAHVKRQLAAVHAATARFRLPSAAIKKGYVATSTCVAMPGVGGMGYHYANPANIADGVLNIRRPEVLVYVSTPHGLRLGAVEYFQRDADQNLATATDRPSLFGRPFDGPMLGHEPGMPVHYDLHVWMYKHNPAGMFAPWNPTVTCPVH
jgi:hypothetical protein